MAKYFDIYGFYLNHFVKILWPICNLRIDDVPLSSFEYNNLSNEVFTVFQVVRYV